MSANVPAVYDSDEAYAYAIGQAAGRYLQVIHHLDSSYGSAAGVLTYSRYDKRVLHSILERISKALGIRLRKGHEKDEIAEIADAQKSIGGIIDGFEVLDPRRDYAYFFHRGALAQLGGAQ